MKKLRYKLLGAAAAAALIFSGTDAKAAPQRWTSPFSDIGQTAWYFHSVEFAHENGLMAGRGGSIFDPDGTMTRAMAVTTLWRYAGEPTGYANNFLDVPEHSWYSQAVAWAAGNGIVEGVDVPVQPGETQISGQLIAAVMSKGRQTLGFKPAAFRISTAFLTVWKFLSR